MRTWMAVGVVCWALLPAGCSDNGGASKPGDIVPETAADVPAVDVPATDVPAADVWEVTSDVPGDQPDLTIDVLPDTPSGEDILADSETPYDVPEELPALDEISDVDFEAEQPMDLGPELEGLVDVQEVTFPDLILEVEAVSPDLPEDIWDQDLEAETAVDGGVELPDIYTGGAEGCAEEEWGCGDDVCIGLEQRCDGQIQCPGGVDEEPAMCAELVCEPDGYACAGGLMTICQGGVKTVEYCNLLCVLELSAGFAECAYDDDAGHDVCMCVDEVPVDVCAEQGLYSDDECDAHCPLPDPDCGDFCDDPGMYGDGICDAWCALPDPDCEEQ